MSKARSNRGFTMVEMIVVVAIIFILVVIAIPIIWPAVRSAKGDAAASYVVNQVRRTRERAVDERRKYRIDFVAPRTINIQQGNFDVATNATIYSFDSTIDLPIETQFMAPNPSGTAGAPDGAAFGAQNLAIDFTVTGAARGGTSIICNPDGTITDLVGGNTTGTLYTKLPSDWNTTRAITVFGATGRAKVWRLTKNGANYVWAIQ